jgi:hypothetical protein
MQVIIDRFEGEIAVCEQDDRTMLNIPRSQLPDGAKEGDVLIIDGDNISIDSSATLQRKKSINARFKNLIRKSK